MSTNFPERDPNSNLDLGFAPTRAELSQNTQSLNSKTYNLEEIDEYIVTLKDANDLESFYDDLETEGSSCDHVPDRCVECCLRREISRNTHYLLSQEEAERLKSDDRVLDVIPKKLKESVKKFPSGWKQSSSEWNKSPVLQNSHRNWGLLRCMEGEQISNWGSNENVNATGSITATSSGKNVDVIIADGFIDPTHPEVAFNQDGTGGSRAIQFNWSSLNSVALGTSNSTYTYPTTYTAYGDNHGMHVAGTAVGNSQGWARDANIYNLYVYGGTGEVGNVAYYPFDYARAFHMTKSLNELIGKKNPTIMNNSWGYGQSVERSIISTIVYRGTTYTGPFTDQDLESFGIIEYDNDNVYILGWFASEAVDVQDAIDEGVIIVGAAGNTSYKIDVPGGQDYDNRIVTTSNVSWYYHRGSVNVAAANAICVGNIDDLSNDTKRPDSCTGPRVTVYAPGTSIISSVHDGPANDYRNSTYKIDKYNGTSMASPQVCGVLACLLEQYPRFTQVDAVNYLNKISKKNQVLDTLGGYTDNTSLQGSNNQYLFYKKERLESGYVTPKVSRNTRSNSGLLYPRKNPITYTTKPPSFYGLTWNTTVVNPCNPNPWIITNNNLNIKYVVEDSANCGGTCAAVQSGTASATITIGGTDVLMSLNFNGIGEAEDSGFERITFSLNGTLIARAESTNKKLGCSSFLPVSKTFIQSSPYLLEAGSTHTLLINFTTGDALFHVGCFYEVQLGFSESGA